MAAGSELGYDRNTRDRGRVLMSHSGRPPDASDAAHKLLRGETMIHRVPIGLLLAAVVACGGDDHGTGGEGGVAQGGSSNSGSGGEPTGTGGGEAGGETGGSGGYGGGGGSDRGGTGNAGSGAGDGGSAGDDTGGDGGDAGNATGGMAGAAAGQGGSAGMGGLGGECIGSATRPCCQDGTQTCAEGVWGACAGAFLSAESCNGVDDDCDGDVDEELGSFRCGIGACAREVPACTSGTLATCVPPQPTSTTDGCNELDDDCDGAVDEDCATCVHVSPVGDDAAAAASDGAVPFASIQAAIDFASSFRSVAKRVCVASGPACGATFAYQGATDADLTMRNGIDVLGGYESTAWTRCSSSITRLLPQTARGVYFPPSIATRTILDGFTIDAPSQTTAGVTLEGARGVLLSNLRVGDSGTTLQRGIDLTNAEAEVFRSSVKATQHAAASKSAETPKLSSYEETASLGPWFSAHVGARRLGSSTITLS
jgi:Putative metal-binding motif